MTVMLPLPFLKILVGCLNEPRLSVPLSGQSIRKTPTPPRSADVKVRRMSPGCKSVPGALSPLDKDGLPLQNVTEPRSSFSADRPCWSVLTALPSDSFSPVTPARGLDFAAPQNP